VVALSPIRRLPARSRTAAYTPAYRRERRRKIVGWLFVAVGSVMAVVHIVAHLGRLNMVGQQDLLLGYPMAAALVLAGFLLVGSVAKC